MSNFCLSFLAKMKIIKVFTNQSILFNNKNVLLLELEQWLDRLVAIVARFCLITKFA